MSAAVLLVGNGRRGRDWLAAIRSRRGCDPVAVVDPDSVALAAAERAGLRAFATLDAALRDGAAGASAAVICSPHEQHAADAISCLEAGLGVLVEKPLALSLADAMAVADAADGAGLPAIAAHNFRHRPLERAIRGALDSGAIGELRAMHVATARPAAPTTCDHTPLWDLAVHHLDLMRLRLGSIPDAIDARQAEGGGGVTYSARLTWAGRASADYWLREGASVYHHAEWLEGSVGALRAVDGKLWLVTGGRRPRRLRIPRGPAPERVLLDALFGEGDAAAAAGARESLGTIAMVEAAVRSIATEAPVRPGELAGAGVGS